MSRTRNKGFMWPWYCAGLTLAALGLGMVADGPADWAAAVLLFVPMAVTLKHLYAALR